jgi:hypothetical protein
MPEATEPKRKITLLEDSALVSGGKVQKRGSEHTVSAIKARHLITAGKAKYSAESKSDK